MSEGQSPDRKDPIASDQSADDTAVDRLRLGGMALENGLLVYGPTHWSAAVRDRGGEIIVRSGKVPRASNFLENVPGLRGVVRLAESIVVVPLVRMKLPQARLPFENKSVIAAGAATTALGMFARRRVKRGVALDTALSLVGLAPALISLRSGNVAAYHGVEHKAIAAYEQGGDPTDAAVVEAAAKEHDRCGSHLVAPMMLAGVIGDALVRRTIEQPGAVVQASVALAGAAVSIEMFGYAERHPGSGFAKAFRRPGFELQRAIGTREPSVEQIEVGRAAIARLLEVEDVAV
ncbi:MAG: DUF1385 domain-containing protein [Solirubrobacterales bacterium]